MRRLVWINPDAIKEGPEGFTVFGKADRANELVTFRMSPGHVSLVRKVPGPVSGVYVEESAVVEVTALPEPGYDEEDV